MDLKLWTVVLPFPSIRMKVAGTWCQCHSFRQLSVIAGRAQLLEYPLHHVYYSTIFHHVTHSRSLAIYYDKLFTTCFVLCHSDQEVQHSILSGNSSAVFLLSKYMMHLLMNGSLHLSHLSGLLVLKQYLPLVTWSTKPLSPTHPVSLFCEEESTFGDDYKFMQHEIICCVPLMTVKLYFEDATVLSSSCSLSHLHKQCLQICNKSCYFE